ncbi:MAG TPA: hypothetical protein VF103_15030 [Polyangiaceae bacterium]
MRGKVALCSLVGCLGYSSPALAEPPPVSVTLEDCPHLDPAEVERIFAAELGSAASRIVDPSVTEVNIHCDAERVVIRVKDPLSRKIVQRSFDTSTFDLKATPRLIALAASELVLASWAELYSNPTPTVEPEGPKPPPEEASAARQALRERSFFAGEPEGPQAKPNPDLAEERVLRLVAIASFRGFPGEEGGLWGGGARLGEEPLKLVSWALDTVIERGDLHGEKVTSATFGASLLANYSIKKVFTLRLGAGLRAGVLGGSEPHLAPWGWPLGVTMWTLRIGSFVTDLSAEAGYVVVPISHGNEVRGYWVSGQLGFGMVL